MRNLLFLGLAALAVGLAGCGGGDSADETNPSASGGKLEQPASPVPSGPSQAN